MFENLKLKFLTSSRHILKEDKSGRKLMQKLIYGLKTRYFLNGTMKVYVSVKEN